MIESVMWQKTRPVAASGCDKTHVPPSPRGNNYPCAVELLGVRLLLYLLKDGPLAKLISLYVSLSNSHQISSNSFTTRKNVFKCVHINSVILRLF